MTPIKYDLRMDSEKVEIYSDGQWYEVESEDKAHEIAASTGTSYRVMRNGTWDEYSPVW